MRYLLVLLVISLIYSNKALSTTQIPIYQYFPQCDYSVVNEIKLQQKLTVPAAVSSQDIYAKAIKQLVEEAQEKAREMDVDGIAFIHRTEKKVERTIGLQTRGTYRMLVITAQFIKACETDHAYPKKITPIAQNGEKQFILKHKKSNKQLYTSVALPNNQKRLAPPLSSNIVSFKNGVYGIALGSSIDSMYNTFGDPTFVMPINSEYLLVAYGRRQWFLFANKTLVFASSNSPWLSVELVNFLVFDERFDNQEWSIEGQINKSAKLEHVIQLDSYISHNDVRVILQDNTQEILIHTEKYASEVLGKSDIKVLGFTIQRQGFTLPKFEYEDHTPEVIAAIEAYLIDPDRNELLASTLDVEPIASAWLKPTSQLLIFGPQLILEKRGAHIFNVHFIEDAFDVAKRSDMQSWRFRGLRQGQTLQEVLLMLGDEAFHLGDLVEVVGNKYRQNLYFYSHNNNMELLTSKLSIY